MKRINVAPKQLKSHCFILLSYTAELNHSVDVFGLEYLPFFNAHTVTWLNVQVVEKKNTNL